MERNKILNLIGIFLISLALLRLFFLYQVDAIFQFFWLCNHVPLILGTAILFRANKLLIAEFCIGFFGMFVYVMDYIIYLLWGISYTGNFQFFGSALPLAVSLAMHVLTMPLAFLAIWIINKKEINAWTYSLIHILFLLPIVLYLGPAANVNCLFKSCISFMPTNEFYSLILILAYFSLLILPLNLLFNELLGKNRKRLRNSSR
ncbi:MAG: hypothetical protein AABX17_02065 [Nanoarchaeota archaeon]